MASKLTIWCNAELPPDALAELKLGTQNHHLEFEGQATSNLAAGGASELLATADVAFGQPDPHQSMGLSGLRWIHLTSAGYTRYSGDDFRAAIEARGATMTNSSSVFDEPCAQHLLAFMLGFARQLPQAAQCQTTENKWQYARLRAASRILRDETVLLLGFGAIARRLGELLVPFGLNVIAVRQTPRGDEPVPTHPVTELDQLLPQADHVVNTLPASASTDKMLNADRIALIRPGAKFYNVGRGTTVDQMALQSALQTGHLACAYLDVTDPEPLPDEHPLWSAPNCFITPHIAGGFQTEHLSLVRHFLANLKRFENDEALADRVI